MSNAVTVAEKPGRTEAGKGNNTTQPRPVETRLESAPPARPYMLIFYCLVAAALFLGWIKSAEEHLVPDSGAGYALGIVGGSMMLALLLYPVRKKARFMRSFGPLKYWFWTHMVLGILGPVLVVFHSNFELGSTNSRVVLSATLLVAGSGLVGRYIYTKVHYGLYGRQMTLKELLREMDVKKTSLVYVLGYAPKLQDRLLAFDEAALKPRYSLFKSLLHYFVIGVRARWTHLMLRIGLRRALKVAAMRSGWSDLDRKRRGVAARGHIAANINSALKIAEFCVYERLLALWHIFHFPLFILLIITAVVHVIAVHMY
jgi:hypothetical protein